MATALSTRGGPRGAQALASSHEKAVVKEKPVLVAVNVLYKSAEG